MLVLSVPRGWHISRISDRTVPLSVEQVKNKAEYVDRLSWLRASEIGSCGIDGNGRSGWKLTVDPLELFYRARKAKYVPLESKFHIVCRVNFCQRAEGSIERQLILFRLDRPLREASGRKNIDGQDLLLHIIAYYKRVEGRNFLLESSLIKAFPWFAWIHRSAIYVVAWRSANFNKIPPSFGHVLMHFAVNCMFHSEYLLFYPKYTSSRIYTTVILFTVRRKKMSRFKTRDSTIVRVLLPGSFWRPSVETFATLR